MSQPAADIGNRTGKPAPMLMPMSHCLYMYQSKTRAVTL